VKRSADDGRTVGDGSSSECFDGFERSDLYVCNLLARVLN